MNTKLGIFILLIGIAGTIAVILIPASQPIPSLISGFLVGLGVMMAILN